MTLISYVAADDKNVSKLLMVITCFYYMLYPYAFYYIIVDNTLLSIECMFVCVCVCILIFLNIILINTFNSRIYCMYLIKKCS